MGAVTHTHNAHTYPTLTVGRCVCAWVVRDWRQKVLIHPNPHTHTLTVVVVVVVVVAVAHTHNPNPNPVVNPNPNNGSNTHKSHHKNVNALKTPTHTRASKTHTHPHTQCLKSSISSLKAHHTRTHTPIFHIPTRTHTPSHTGYEREEEEKAFWSEHSLSFKRFWLAKPHTCKAKPLHIYAHPHTHCAALLKGLFTLERRENSRSHTHTHTPPHEHIAFAWHVWEVRVCVCVSAFVCSFCFLLRPPCCDCEGADHHQFKKKNPHAHTHPQNEILGPPLAPTKRQQNKKALRSSITKEKPPPHHNPQRILLFLC